MSQKTNRHQRKPSQGAFVFPDDLSDPLPKNDAGGSKAAPAPAPAPPGSTAGVAHPPLTVDKSGAPGLPPPPAKSLEEMSTHNPRESKASNVSSIE